MKASKKLNRKLKSRQSQSGATGQGRKNPGSRKKKGK